MAAVSVIVNQSYHFFSLAMPHFSIPKTHQFITINKHDCGMFWQFPFSRLRLLTWAKFPLYSGTAVHICAQVIL